MKLMRSAVVVLACAGLLSACSSKPPVEAPVVQKKPVPQVRSGKAEDVLFRAIGLVGTPYRWGGNTPDSGFDCSGLIAYVYKDMAQVHLPRTTREMIVMPGQTVHRQSLNSGDLVFFATSGGRQVSHAGIYVGEGRFVHAPSTGGTVRLDRLDNPYWSKAYLDAKRVLPAQRSSVLAHNP